jgi:VWFA-related protein
MRSLTRSPIILLVLLFLLHLCFLPFSAHAQESAPPAQPAPAAQSAPANSVPSPAAPASDTSARIASSPDANHRISIDVVVTDKSGNPVPGLQQQDFTLLDGKQPQPILSFHATEASSKDAEPVQVIFLLDGVNIGVQSVGVARTQLENFLRRDGGKLELPTSLALFTDTSTQFQPTPTRDGNGLVQSLEANPTGLRSIGRSTGFYGATERLDLSLRTLEGLIAREIKQPGRKLLVWISPGWPLLTGPGIQLTVKDQTWMFNAIVSFSKELRDARMTLYSIDPLGMSDAVTGRTTYWQGFVKGVPAAKKVEGGNLALQVLATQSGGRVLNSSNDLTSLIASCMVDAKAYYTLSFEAPPADHPDEFHSLEVKIDKPGLTARTRTGYYAQPYPNPGR